MDIIEVQRPLWDKFLQRNDHFIFHTPRYKKFIEKSFNCKYKVLGVLVNNEFKTILPVVFVKSKLFGNKIISTGYLEYGGFAGDVKYVSMLVDYLTRKYEENNNYLEIRGGLNGYDTILSKKLKKANLYKRFVLHLGDKETVWCGIQKSKRKAIKKSLKNIKVKEIDNIDEFYNLYLRNMRSFGSPPYSKNYFKQFSYLTKNSYAKMLGGYYQGKLVSALLGFMYDDRVHILIAVSDSKFREFRPNDAVHWKFIEFSIKNNYKFFDFGRVREESGQFEYKRKFGATLMHLPSYFLMWNKKEIPIVDPAKHGMVVKIWKKMPLSFTKFVGHYLRKGLGI